ncbi:MAG: hypothetical protein IT371_03490 [Deltaproteobacteria bacterium]|nr:hypothetical protein [Deltaproteobacteria bacterium]
MRYAMIGRQFGPGLLLAGLLAACEPPPAALPPAWCKAEGPLELDCAGPYCVAAVAVDYKRLVPRGYRVFTLDGRAIPDKASAEAAALRHVTEVLKAPAPELTDVVRAGDFFACFLGYRNSDGWVVVLHAPTGHVLFAGKETWADDATRGHDPPLPAGFLDPAPLGCEAPAAEPTQKRLLNTGVPLGSAPPSTAAEAWELVRGLNLTSRFTAGQPYQALVVSYSPAIGEFDPEAADWYVWLALER